jgi:hypothetical protein
VAERRAAVACIAAGAAWLALVPASVLFRDGDLSYGGYFRLMAVPLALFVVAWWLLGRVWSWSSPRARWGYRLVLVGLALAFVGDTLEFWGSWLLDEPVSRDAPSDAWWGSNAGWSLFLFGFLLLLVGGPTAAVALRPARLPFWALALVTVLAFGILVGNALHDASLLTAAIGLGIFGAAWIGLGVVLLRRPPHAFSSTPT